MDILEISRSAVASVLGNKMRSILTMLGIIIGIASVIMITSIGNGLQATITGEFDAMGLSAIQISVNGSKGPVASDYLKLADVEMVKEHPEVEYVAPLKQNSSRVRLKNPVETARFYAVGTTEDYRMIQAADLAYGRFISAADAERKARVAIIDENLAMKIFGRKDATGENIKTAIGGNAEFMVIGITKSASVTAMFDIPSTVIVPIDTLLDLRNETNVDSLLITVKDKAKINQTATELNRLLEITHNTSDKYRAENLMQQMESIDKIFSGVTAFVSLVAAISLLVGGIGVMNIMLVTVTERTREIGIRKAIGATDGNISFQFLVEAVILTAAGGVIGIAAGYAGSKFLGNLVQLTPVLFVPMVVFTVALSSVIGIAFGVYPARKAAKLDPIDALRYE